jgi:hypothetical protein
MPSLPPKDHYYSAELRALMIEPAMATYVFPLIRTLTVGLGISPSPPLAGCKRVADFDCRFGITPTPETTGRVYLIAIPERHFALEGIKSHRSKPQGKCVELFEFKSRTKSSFRRFTRFHPESLANFV